MLTKVGTCRRCMSKQISTRCFSHHDLFIDVKVWLLGVCRRKLSYCIPQDSKKLQKFKKLKIKQDFKEIEPSGGGQNNMEGCIWQWLVISMERGFRIIYKLRWLRSYQIPIRHLWTHLLLGFWLARLSHQSADWLIPQTKRLENTPGINNYLLVQCCSAQFNREIS